MEMKTAFVFLAMVLLVSVAAGQEQAPSDMPEHHHDHAAMNRRGADAMGFDQQKVTHHFLLTKDGGVVQVEAKDTKDGTSIAEIQNHLALQAQKFSAGDFGAPEHTHAQVPPGVPTMKELRGHIRYEFEKSSMGGKLQISSSDPKAIEAVHEFLKFQIKDHDTGDSGDVE
jgi:hypothetical protein